VQKQSLAAPQALDQGFSTERESLVNSEVYQLQVGEGGEPVLCDGGPSDLGKSPVDAKQLDAVGTRQLNWTLTQDRLPLFIHR
jgi:hypothetical protein